MTSPLISPARLFADSSLLLQPSDIGSELREANVLPSGDTYGGGHETAYPAPIRKERATPMQTQTGFAELNGTRLYYEVAGSGHPLVLIHGMSLDTRMWEDQFEPLAHHYQVVCYDACGFGKSVLPTEGSYVHTDDLQALLAYLDITHAFILGLSMGGSIAIDFAMAYPEATDALMPVDSRLSGWRPDPEYAAFQQAVRLRAREAGIQAARDVWLHSPVFNPALGNPEVAPRL